MVGRVIYIHHHLTLVGLYRYGKFVCCVSGKNEAALDRDDIIYCDILTTLNICKEQEYDIRFCTLQFILHFHAQKPHHPTNNQHFHPTECDISMQFLPWGKRDRRVFIIHHTSIINIKLIKGNKNGVIRDCTGYKTARICNLLRRRRRTIRTKMVYISSWPKYISWMICMVQLPTLPLTNLQ